MITVKKGKHEYAQQPDGMLVPLKLIAKKDLRCDELVEKLIDNARDAHRALREMKGNNQLIITELAELHGLDPEEVGNVTYNNYDHSAKVSIKIGKKLTFGPEIIKAKKIIDECVIEWSKSSKAELVKLVTHAFATDKSGKLRRDLVLSLLNLEIEDKRWSEAMKLITASLQSEYSRTYHGFFERDTEGDWLPIYINYSKVKPVHQPTDKKKKSA